MGKSVKFCALVLVMKTLKTTILGLLDIYRVVLMGPLESTGAAGSKRRVRTLVAAPARLVARTVILVKIPVTEGEPVRLKMKPLVENPNPPGRLEAVKPIGNCPAFVFCPLVLVKDTVTALEAEGVWYRKVPLVAASNAGNAGRMRNPVTLLVAEPPALVTTTVKEALLVARLGLEEPTVPTKTLVLVKARPPGRLEEEKKSGNALWF